MVELDGVMIFSASKPSTGQELWRSSGIHSGTEPIKDIRDGAQGSDPARFTRVGNLVYFTADDGVIGRELWVTDGTAGGTRSVMDIKPGVLGSNPSQLTAVGDKLYFRADGLATANPDNKDEELWITDGVETRRVRNLNTAGSSAPQSITPMGNWVYFVATDGGPNGTELWRTDGSSDNTKLVKNIYPGGQGSLPRDLTVVGNVLYFSAEYPENQRNLWKSNGQLGNATKVDWESFNHVAADPLDLTAGAGTLYFTAKVTQFIIGAQPGTLDEDVPHGRELGYLPPGATAWKYVDINPGAPSAFRSDVSNELTYVGNHLYFSASNGAQGREPWKSDGTVGGTSQVADLVVGDSEPAGFTWAGSGSVVFSAKRNSAQRELFVTKGTPATTQLVAILAPELSLGSNPLNLTGRSEVVYFRASTAATGEELWKYSSKLPKVFLTFANSVEGEGGAETTEGSLQSVSAEFEIDDNWYDPYDPSDIVVTFDSLDPNKIPNNQILLEGAGRLRTLRATPLAEAKGIARIKLTATNPAGAVTTQQLDISILPDQDGDGLADQWETSGIRIGSDGTIDLTLPGADPRHKDLYLEIDAMQGYAPSPEAIELVKAAFAAAPADAVKNPDGLPGINLHVVHDDDLGVGEINLPIVDFNHSTFAQQFGVARSLGPKDKRDLDRLARTKLLYQRTAAESQAISEMAARELVYRYQLFGRSLVVDDVDDVDDPKAKALVGLGELPGDDSVVTLGRWKDRDGDEHNGATAEQQAGVMMHELGHNLGLGHGGGIGTPEMVEIQAESFARRQSGIGHQWSVVDQETPAAGGVFSGATGPAQDFVQSLTLAGQDSPQGALAPGTPFVEYDVQISSSGVYELKLRVAGVTSSSDSLWVEVPTGALADAQGLQVVSGGLKVESTINGVFETRNAGRWSLSAGLHRIRLSMRESGAAVDALQLTPVSLLFTSDQLEIDDKPNYFSAMNGLWITPVASNEVSWRLDYSRRELPPIRESDVRESAGIGWDPDKRVNVYLEGPQLLVLSDGLDDWNGDGIISDGPLAVDLNGDGDTTDVFVGYNDWANLRYQLGVDPNFDPAGINSCFSGIGTCDGTKNEVVPVEPLRFVPRSDFYEPNDGEANAARLLPTILAVLITPDPLLCLATDPDPNENPSCGRNVALKADAYVAGDIDTYRLDIPVSGLVVAEVWATRTSGMPNTLAAALTLRSVDGHVEQGPLPANPGPDAKWFQRVDVFNSHAGPVIVEFKAEQSVPQYRLRLQFIPAGDVNRDYKVDLTDFGIFKERFGKTPADWVDGDFNYDNRVDLTDFGVLKQNFGVDAIKQYFYGGQE